jgi:hypothetical protein
MCSTQLKKEIERGYLVYLLRLWATQPVFATYSKSRTSKTIIFIAIVKEDKKRSSRYSNKLYSNWLEFQAANKKHLQQLC